ncbi:hypothetical protein BDV97DRAFT_360257 [Delphinella strobiligena]|nr:hypothetical protein BDV97DRAFT_360257 [Delphinella strobiligena]
MFIILTYIASPILCSPQPKKCSTHHTSDEFLQNCFPVFVSLLRSSTYLCFNACWPP